MRKGLPSILLFLAPHYGGRWPHIHIEREVKGRRVLSQQPQRLPINLRLFFINQFQQQIGVIIVSVAVPHLIGGQSVEKGPILPVRVADHLFVQVAERIAVLELWKGKVFPAFAGFPFILQQFVKLAEHAQRGKGPMPYHSEPFDQVTWVICQRGFTLSQDTDEPVDVEQAFDVARVRV